MPHSSGLSPRQILLLQGLADGKGSRQLCEELELSGATFTSYVSRIYAKLRVASTPHAVAEAMRKGVIR